MSTLKTSNIQHASAASAAITLDANGQATLNGLAYPTSGSLSGRNRIINGDMRIDQRNAGAAVTASTAYPVDRWITFEATSGAYSGQQVTDVPSGQGFVNSIKYTVTTAASTLGATEYAAVVQKIEGYNVSDLMLGSANAKQFTVSFWVKSSLTGTFGFALQNSAQDRAYATTYNISSANTWEYKTITITGDTSGTWATNNSTGLTCTWGLGVGSTYTVSANNTWESGLKFAAAGAVKLIETLNATFYITGVQLEAGSVATPFERRSYGQELALCQRYYETGDYYIRAGVSNASIVTSYYTSAYFMAEKRATPTMTGTNDQGTFSVVSTRTTSTGIGRSDTVANVNNSGTFIANAEL